MLFLLAGLLFLSLKPSKILPNYRIYFISALPERRQNHVWSTKLRTASRGRLRYNSVSTSRTFFNYVSPIVPSSQK